MKDYEEMKEYEEVNDQQAIVREAVNDAFSIGYDRGYDYGYQRGYEDAKNTFNLMTEEEFRDRIAVPAMEKFVLHVRAEKKEIEKYSYQRGLDDAWELAKKVVILWNDKPDYENENYFGYISIVDIFRKLSLTELQDILKKDQEEHMADEITVGDEVYFKEPGDAGIVVHISELDGCKYYTGIRKDGRIWNGGSEYHKTGQHFDQITEILELLKLMREEEE